jgi:hypothetical protein
MSSDLTALLRDSQSQSGMSLTRVFTCGTRTVLAAGNGATITYRVVCATCEAGGTVRHPTLSDATRACVRDSNRLCAACGAS